MNATNTIKRKHPDDTKNFLKSLSYSPIMLDSCIPRLFGLVDRSIHSPTYGCFDRPYWKYKNKGSPNARLQEAVLTLTHLYLDNKSNYFKDFDLLTIIHAGIDFWTRIQHKDGSFDEYIKHEKSHVATAFSSFAVAYSLYLLGESDDRVIWVLEKSCEFLIKNTDLCVANHDAGTVPLFFIMYLLTKKQDYKELAKKRLELVLTLQDEEGWFYEYGGADIGYQSITIYYLSVYRLLSGDITVSDRLDLAIDFLSYFIHPDGTAGGSYGSRGTDIIRPGGLSIIGSGLANSMVMNLKNDFPEAFDDRFICQDTYMFYIKKNKKSFVKLPWQKKKIEKRFPNCGLFVKKEDEIFFIVNLKNGGHGVFFRDGKKEDLLCSYAFEDNGLCITLGESTFQEEDGRIRINAPFYKYKKRMTGTHILSMVQCMNTIGLAKPMKHLLRSMLVKNKKRLDAILTREILLDGGLMIEDNITGVHSLNLKKTDHFPEYSTSTEFFI